MSKKIKIISILIVIIIVIFGLRACLSNNESLENDPNLIELRNLVYEEELCDNDWANKVGELGEKIINDSNLDYLKKYYSNNIDEKFIDKYKNLGELCKEFRLQFIEKNYSEASKTLNKIKEIYSEMGI